MYKIFIDIGHGGKDSGAINSTVYEKTINLVVGSALKKLLVDSGKFDVLCSRETDVFIDLEPRCVMANKWGADIFVSIHHNAGGGDGFECIHSIFHGKGDKLAEDIAAQFRVLGQNAHGQGVLTHESTANPGHDYLCTIRDTNMTSVTVEHAFLDSKDFLDIDTQAEQLAEAEAIFKGICNYFGVVISMPENDWGKEFIKALVDKGIIDQMHDSKEPVTFDVLAKVVCNAIDHIKTNKS